MERKKFFLALEDDVVCLHKNGMYFSTQYHHHDGYELYLFLKGDANYYIEQNCYRIKRGCLFNIRPNELHRVECFDTKVYERITINLKTNFVHELSSEQTNLARCFTDRPFGIDNMIYLNEHQINEFIFLANNLEKLQNSEEYGHDLMAKSYIYQILIFVNNLFLKTTQADPINIMPEIVSKTIMYINDHLTEPITMADIADHVHHNPTYISRCFKRVTGVSLQQYIIYKRIILAKKYLMEGYSLNDTCRLSGFNDYSNFARTFKKQIGCSPKKYQEQPI